MSSPYAPPTYSSSNSVISAAAVSAITNQLFGPPGQHATTGGLYDGYASAVQDITEFVNVPIVTSRIIEGLVNNLPLGVFNILPLRKTNSLLNTASVISFEREPLGRVPPRGGFRTLQSSKRTVTGRLTRYGAAIENDATAVLTPDGERMNDLKFVQVQLATQNTMLMDLLFTLTNSGVDVPFDTSDKAMRDFRLYATSEATRTFAFQKNPQNWTSLVNRAWTELTTVRNGNNGAYALVVPFDFIDAMSTGQRLLGVGEGYDAGSEILNRPARDLSGPVMVLANGVRAYAAPPLHTYEPTEGANSINEAMYNTLQRQVFLSEFVVGPNAEEVDSFSDGTPGSDKPLYKSRFSDVIVYNRDTDDFSLIKREDQLKNAGIGKLPFVLDESKKLGGKYEMHYPPENSGLARLPFYYAWDDTADENAPNRKRGTYEATHLIDLDRNAMSFAHLRKMADSMLASGFVGFDAEDRLYARTWDSGDRDGSDLAQRIETEERTEEAESDAASTASSGKRTAATASLRRQWLAKRTRSTPATRAAPTAPRYGTSNARYWITMVERNSEAGSALQSALRAALEFPLFNWNVIENATRSNIYTPFKVVMVWPRIAFQADSAILAKMGSETGETLWAFPALTSGTDPSNQSTLTSFSIWFDVMVYQPKWIIVLQNYMCRRYDYGGGVVPFTRGQVEKQMARDYEGPIDKPSVLFYALCPSEVVGDMISPAGYWTNTVVSAAAGGVHLSAAWIEKENGYGYGLKDESGSFNPRERFDRELPPSPIVSFPGMHAYVALNGQLVVKQAKGACGPNASGPGSRAVYNRDVPFFPRTDEHLAILERQARNSGLLTIKN
jgi:hypothetical protein